MIDFRYHLVSIVAIFLALAIGLVLGATALQQPLLNQLQRQTNSLATDNQSLRNQVQDLQRQMDGNNQYAQALGPQTVARRLAGEQVVFVETPGASENIRDAIAKTVTDSGATITGRVTFQSKYLADEQLTVLDELTAQVKPASVTYPANATPYDRAAAVLANVLVTNQTSRAGREEPSGGEVLSAFKDQGFLTLTGKPGARATLAVVIAPSAPYETKGADDDNKALVSLASALDAGGRGAVVVGPPTASGDNGMIHFIRGSAAGEKVSTVDAANTPSGQVVAVLALAAELTGKSGHYGIGTGSRAFLPTPVPTARKRG